MSKRGRPSVADFEAEVRWAISRRRLHDPALLELNSKLVNAAVVQLETTRLFPRGSTCGRGRALGVVLSRLLHETAESASGTPLGQLAALLEAGDYSEAEIARRFLHLSPFYLNRKFKKELVQLLAKRFLELNRDVENSFD